MILQSNTLTIIPQGHPYDDLSSNLLMIAKDAELSAQEDQHKLSK